MTSKTKRPVNAVLATALGMSSNCYSSPTASMALALPLHLVSILHRSNVSTICNAASLQWSPPTYTWYYNYPSFYPTSHFPPQSSLSQQHQPATSSYVLSFVSCNCFGCKNKYGKNLQPPVDFCIRTQDWRKFVDCSHLLLYLTILRFKTVRSWHVSLFLKFYSLLCTL